MGTISQLERIKFLDKFSEFASNSLLKIIRNVNGKNKINDGNVVIISLHKLGDTVFTIPAVKQIFNHFPNKRIFIITFPEIKPIYEIVFNKECINVVNKDSFIFGGRIALNKARKILVNLNPEIVFDITGTISSASLIVNSKAKNIIGHNLKYYRSVYDQFTPIRNTPHLIDRYLDVVKLLIPIDASKINKEFPINFSPEGKIFICPLAGWKAKEWGIEKFAELSELLNQNFETEIIFEKDKLSIEEIKQFEGRNIPIIQTTSIQELINKIKECSVFISNDSGPLYIANLLGKPTFTIYGPTNPDYSLPIGKFHKFIQKKISCSPNGTQYCYLQAGLNCPSYECMIQLSVEEVKVSVHEFLSDLGFKSKKELVN